MLHPDQKYELCRLLQQEKLQSIHQERLLSQTTRPSWWSFILSYSGEVFIAIGNNLKAHAHPQLVNSHM